MDEEMTAEELVDHARQNVAPSWSCRWSTPPDRDLDELVLVVVFDLIRTFHNQMDATQGIPPDDPDEMIVLQAILSNDLNRISGVLWRAMCNTNATWWNQYNTRHSREVSVDYIDNLGTEDESPRPDVLLARCQSEQRYEHFRLVAHAYAMALYESNGHLELSDRSSQEMNFIHDMARLSVNEMICFCLDANDMEAEQIVPYTSLSPHSNTVDQALLRARRKIKEAYEQKGTQLNDLLPD